MSLQPHAEETAIGASVEPEPTGMEVVQPAAPRRPRTTPRTDLLDELNALRSANTALLATNAKLSYDLARAVYRPDSVASDGPSDTADVAAVQALRSELAEANARAAQARTEADAERERAEEYKQFIDVLHSWHDAPRYRVADAVRTVILSTPFAGPIAKRIWQALFGRLRVGR